MLYHGGMSKRPMSTGNDLDDLDRLVSQVGKQTRIDAEDGSLDAIMYLFAIAEYSSQDGYVQFYKSARDLYRRAKVNNRRHVSAEFMHIELCHKLGAHGYEGIIPKETEKKFENAFIKAIEFYIEKGDPF